ncbi:MAG: hypothetical protein LC659_13880 [Myxococcales bacterium]|nr:hypothetical protein [Myxococcales bacterium]
MNDELAAIFIADQADRNDWQRIDWAIVQPRDEARLRRVEEILAAGAVVTADDHYHAAMVLQHGIAVEHARRAHELARRAVALDPAHEKARWLCCASEDRVLLRQGRPQRWGTQFDCVDGVWRVYPVDGSVDDAERARWSVPPLAEAHRKAARFNDGQSS